MEVDEVNDVGDAGIITAETMKISNAPLPPEDTKADNNESGAASSLNSSSDAGVGASAGSSMSSKNGENQLADSTTESLSFLESSGQKNELNLRYSSDDDEEEEKEYEKIKEVINNRHYNKNGNDDVSDEYEAVYSPKKKRLKSGNSDSDDCLLGFDENTGLAISMKDKSLLKNLDSPPENEAIEEKPSLTAAEPASKKPKQSPKSSKDTGSFKSPAASPKSTANSASLKKSSPIAMPTHIVGDIEETDGGNAAATELSEATTPSIPTTPSSTTSTKSSHSSKKPPATDEFYKKPFAFGWKRELVWRSHSDSNRERADVYYINPKGKRLRSRNEILPYLKGDLKAEHFNFSRDVLGAGPEFELVRNSKASHRSTSTAATLAAAAASVPASIGKRTPKPKGPKGASPPPEGWTAARALKVNNAALQHSPSHRSSSSHHSHSSSHHSSNRHQNSSHGTTGSGSSKQHSSSNKTKKSPVGASNNIQVDAGNGGGVKQINRAEDRNVVHSPCTYACPKAPGLVPRLQCSKCLCLYHHECVGLNRQRCDYRCVGSNENDSHPGLDYICEACQPPAPQPRPTASNASNSKSVKSNSLSPKAANSHKKSDAISAAKKAAEDQKYPQSIAVIKGKKYLVVSKPVPKSSKNHHVNDIENDLRQIKEGIQHHSRRAHAAKSADSHQNSLRQNSAAASPSASNSAVSTGNVDSLNKLYSANFFANMSFAYGALVCILKYLKIHERSRAASVCKLWNLAAKDTSLWQTVRMKNSKVSNWACFVAALKRGQTQHLDLRKILWPHARSEETWNDFLQHIGTVSSLEIIDLCRCPVKVVEGLFTTNPYLRILNATAINDDSISLECLGQLKRLEELRLRSVESIALVGDLKSLEDLTSLKHLALTSMRGLNAKDVAVLGNLSNLLSLELGECGDFESDFAELTLSRLTNLQRLRLENGQIASIDTLGVLDAVIQMPKLTQLELVNFDIKVGFDEKLSQCAGLRKLLIIPTYISQSATTNNIVLSAVQQIADTLTVFTWGVTVELIRVTALYVDQCEDSMKKDKTNTFSECIPVLKPVPGAESTDEDATTNAMETNENEVAAADVPQIEILPLERVESILATNMPNTKFTILKVPYHSTSRQQIVE